MSSDIEYMVENGITDEYGNVNPSFHYDWAEELRADIEDIEEDEDVDGEEVEEDVEEAFTFKGVEY